MKRIFRFAALLLPVALLTVSCVKEFGSEYGGPLKTYDYVGSLDSGTKTDLDDDDRTIWKATDQVLFYTKGKSEAQPRFVAADGLKAYFDAVEAESYVSAVYGATASKWGTNGFYLSNVIKPTQDGTFGDAHVSAAHSKDVAATELFFYNITSMLKFTIQRQDIAYVRVESRSRAQLYGDVQVIFNESGIPEASWYGTSGGSSIKVTTSNKSGVFYMSLLPGTYKDGFEFRCYNSAGQRIGAAISRKTLELPRNRILDLGVLENSFAPEPEDLGNIIGTNETANCYIAPSAPKEYKFHALYKGNSHTPLGIDEPNRAEVLWETYGTSENPVAGTVVSDVSYSDGYVYLTALRNGSAIIAVRDEDENILWSWHIWVWDGFDIMAAAQQYYNDAGYLMDRNLGASSATIGEIGARGLMFQWGRKDPFLGATSAAVSSDDIKEKHVLVASSDETGTVQYATEHPMTFIYYSNASTGDWLSESNASDNLWSGDSKTIYDPCPPGWRMPEADFWQKALKGSTEFTKKFDTSTFGIDFSGANDGRNMGAGPSLWYPATGYRDGSSNSASISWIQFYNFMWTGGARNGYGVDLAILGLESAVKSSTTSRKSSGLSVRCKLDYTPPVVEVTGITLDKTSLTLKRYESAQLTAVVTPSYAASTKVHWETSGSGVATVDADGLVTGAGEGSCVITAYGSYADGTKNPSVKAQCSVTVSKDEDMLLAPANCFIVSRPGEYHFDGTIKGNGTKSELEPVFARMLWQSYGSDAYPTLPIIANVSLDATSGQVSFTVPSPMQNGNAVIAVLGATGKILWSWHIWACTGFDPEGTHHHVYNHTKAIVMDRNLGATSATKGNVKALGLLYQWGRKDPFLGPRSISESETQKAISDASWPEALTSNDSCGNIQYTVENPMTYISGASPYYDWMYVRTDNLWDDEGKKTIYDPCPAGWKVPAGGSAGLWAVSWYGDNVPSNLSVAATFDTIHRGFELTGTETSGFSPSTIWFPFAAYLTRTGGKLGGQGQYTRLWTSTPTNSSNTSSQAMFMNYGSGGNGDMLLSTTWQRAFAASIRCVKE
ncbi:MAG: Ig-like domain-containing protein [Bacteroidales bacterium]|nr:Ig-like domain-containing protein [Bacteroidales bacterium]